MALPVPELKTKVVIRDVVLKYAHLGRPSGKFTPENPTYEVNITTYDMDVKKLLQAMGAKVETDVEEESGKACHSTTLRSKSLNVKTGEKMIPPTVVGMNKLPIDPNIIGNGSIGDVVISSYAYTFKEKKGTAVNLHAVRVKVLHKYERAESNSLDLFEDDDSETVVIESEEASADDFDDMPY